MRLRVSIRRGLAIVAISAVLFGGIHASLDRTPVTQVYQHNQTDLEFI